VIGLLLVLALAHSGELEQGLIMYAHRYLAPSTLSLGTPAPWHRLGTSEGGQIPRFSRGGGTAKIEI
jgi:hypothetical protein